MPSYSTSTPSATIRQETEPSAADYLYWIKASTNETYYSNGTNWTLIKTFSVPAQATAPSDTDAGRLWFDTDEEVLKVANGISYSDVGNMVLLNETAFITGGTINITGLDYTHYRYYKIYFEIKANLAVNNWLFFRLNNISAVNSYTSNRNDGATSINETADRIIIGGFRDTQSCVGELLIQSKPLASGMNSLSGSTYGYRTGTSGPTSFFGGRLNFGTNISSVQFIAGDGTNCSGTIKIYGIK